MSATATPAKGKKVVKVTNKYAKLSYFDMLAEAEKPIAERQNLPIGRGGAKSVLRRFHLLDNEIADFRKLHAEGDRFPNPHNRGCYFYIWEALKNLGLNGWHQYKEVRKELKRLMSAAETKDGEGATAWDRFANKPSRSEKGRDVDGRILQNVEVMQRITGKNPYGIKVNQIAQEVVKDSSGNYLKGACIDIRRDGEKTPVLIRLNTRPEDFLVFDTKEGKKRVAVPRNDLKARRKSVNADNVKIVKVKKRKPAAKVADVAEKVAEVAPLAAEVSEAATGAVVLETPELTVDVREQNPEDSEVAAQ